MAKDDGGQGASRALEWLFYALAIAGLVGTQAQLPHFLHDGFLSGTQHFWAQALSTPAGTFLTIDVLVLGTAVFVWMFGEARRLQMRFAWVYFIGSLLIGISTFIPLFMALRQRKLRARALHDALPRAVDWVAVAFAIACSLAVVVFSVQGAING